MDDFCLIAPLAHVEGGEEWEAGHIGSGGGGASRPATGGGRRSSAGAGGGGGGEPTAHPGGGRAQHARTSRDAGGATRGRPGRPPPGAAPPFTPAGCVATHTPHRRARARRLVWAAAVAWRTPPPDGARQQSRGRPRCSWFTAARCDARPLDSSGKSSAEGHKRVVHADQEEGRCTAPDHRGFLSRRDECGQGNPTPDTASIAAVDFPRWPP